MKRNLILLLLVLLANILFGQFQTKMHTQYSQIVKDSFEIYISLPSNYSINTKYNVVYYCDANLKSGNQLRSLISKSQINDQLSNVIFVGIGHIGNYHKLRRRDFILPATKGSKSTKDDKNYGQIQKFYLFVKEELVPSINSKYKTNKDGNSIIGHSLGGLFAFYCLFKGEDLFSKYFALSPALWIDKFSIYRFNDIHTGFNHRKYLYFSSGSKESFNKILSGTNQAKRLFDNAKYNNLVYDYDVWEGKSHNSEVTLSLGKIIREKL